MAYSYIHFHDSGFYANDSDIVVFARILLKVSRTSQSLPSAVATLLEGWNESLDSSGPGCIDLRLDGLADQVSIDCMCALLDMAGYTWGQILPFGICSNAISDPSPTCYDT